MQDIPRVDRPREKLVKYGPERLSNSELLAILLRTGREGVNVVDLSTRILQKFDHGSLAQATTKELLIISGLGKAKACEIVASFELSRRLLKDKKHTLLMTPESVWDELKDIRSAKKEHFVIFYLDTRNQEIQRETISVGTLNASLVHPREVFEPAIRNFAAQIIIAHNHPSGNPEPSDEDIQITRNLFDAGKLLGIDLIDHIIVSEKKYFSIKGENRF